MVCQGRLISLIALVGSPWELWGRAASDCHGDVAEMHIDLDIYHCVAGTTYNCRPGAYATHTQSCSREGPGTLDCDGWGELVETGWYMVVAQFVNIDTWGRVESFEREATRGWYRGVP